MAREEGDGRQQTPPAEKIRAYRVGKLVWTYITAMDYLLRRLGGSEGLTRNRDSASPRFCKNASD